MQGTFPLITEFPDDIRVEVDLTKSRAMPGVVAELKIPCNTSDIMRSEMPIEEAQRFAQNYETVLFPGKKIAPEIVIIAHKIAAYWVGPLLEGDLPPDKDDFVRLSIADSAAFTGLAQAIGKAMAPQEEKALQVATRDFPEEAQHTNGQPSPASEELAVIPVS